MLDLALVITFALIGAGTVIFLLRIHLLLCEQMTAGWFRGFALPKAVANVHASFEDTSRYFKGD